MAPGLHIRNEKYGDLENQNEMTDRQENQNEPSTGFASPVSS